MVHGVTGERVFGFDYYQNLMLWALPAAIDGKSLDDPCKPGGLVDWILQAGKQVTRYGRPHKISDRRQ